MMGLVWILRMMQYTHSNFEPIINARVVPVSISRMTATVSSLKTRPHSVSGTGAFSSCVWVLNVHPVWQCDALSDEIEFSSKSCLQSCVCPVGVSVWLGVREGGQRSPGVSQNSYSLRTLRTRPSSVVSSIPASFKCKAVQIHLLDD